MSGILGQSAPGAVLTDIYTVPAATIATARVIVANRGAVELSFRIALSENGDAIANKHYVAFDEPIGINESGSSIGFILSAGDIVRVYGSTADISFTVTGDTRSA